MFNTVDTLMLRAMIAIQTLNIVHYRNSAHIGNKNRNADDSLNDNPNCIGRNPFLQQIWQKIRKYHKNTDCKCKRYNHRQRHQKLFRTLLLLFFDFGHLFFFLFLIEACWPGQSLHPQHQRINKIKDSSDKRQLRKCRIFSNYTFICICCNFYLSVRLSHRNRITFFILHHHAFDDSLTTNIRRFHILLCPF